MTNAILQTAQRIANAAYLMYLRKLPVEGEGPQTLATAFTAVILEECMSGRLVIPESPGVSLHKVKVIGGLFDGDESPPDSIERIIQTPAGKLVHYELVYQDRGEVTREEAEKIIGKRLD